jgi:hypothetical protein
VSVKLHYTQSAAYGNILQQAFFIGGYEPASEMARFHALIVFMLVTVEHCIAELLLECNYKSTRFFSTSQLEMVQYRKVEVERIEYFGLELGLHLGQGRVRII